jgi:tetratricopeptide (TPR) repeat protein
MKGSERHHLKDNELVNLAVRIRRFVEEQQRALAAALLAILAVAGAALGYVWWQGRTEAQAEAAIAEAVGIEESPVVAPGDPGTTTESPGSPNFATDQARVEAALAKYKAVADAYPSTDAGLFARYKEAAALVTLGRHAEAASAYGQVSAAAGSQVIGEAARLGAAEAQARAGEYDQAIAAYQAAANRTDGPLPVEAVLMQLGRTYHRAGKAAEARETYSRIVQEFPASPITAEAQRELDLLNQT